MHHYELARQFVLSSWLLLPSSNVDNGFHLTFTIHSVLESRSFPDSFLT
jgi:hypothetical protein